MAFKDSQLEVLEIYSETDVSDADYDSEIDPDYDILKETHGKFSGLSIDKKPKARVDEARNLSSEADPEEPEMTPRGLDEKDEKNLEQVQKIIEAGLIENLKVGECKLYLRKYGLRLTGKKDTLIQRVTEHLEIINGGGERIYPPSSFVFDCKGDACAGDVVLFEQNVYETFNIASRSASGPPCGKRIVAGRIVKESYGAAKQQHTFTIEVLWSKGEKALPPLHPLLIKGRNLYRFKTLRQRWGNEAERQKILLEKHSRGSVARADREARIQEKEKRAVMENRVSKKESLRNQCQSHSHRTKSQLQPQESDISMASTKPAFSSHYSGLSTRLSKPTSQVQPFGSSAIAEKPAAVVQQCDWPVNCKKIMAMVPRQLGRSTDSALSIEVNPELQRQKLHLNGQNQLPSWHSVACRSTYDTNHTGRAELSTNYNWPNILYKEEQATVARFPCITETNEFTRRIHHRKPLKSVNNFLPLMPKRESYKQKQLCRHHARGRCHFGDSCKFSHDLREQTIRL